MLSSFSFWCLFHLPNLISIPTTLPNPKAITKHLCTSFSILSKLVVFSKPFSPEFQWSLSWVSLLLLKSSSSGLQWNSGPRLKSEFPFVLCIYSPLANLWIHVVLSTISMLVTLKFTFQDWKLFCVTDKFTQQIFIKHLLWFYSRLLGCINKTRGVRKIINKNYTFFKIQALEI